MYVILLSIKINTQPAVSPIEFVCKYFHSFQTALFAQKYFKTLSFYHQVINRLMWEAKRTVHSCLLEDYEDLQRGIFRLQCDLNALHYGVMGREIQLHSPKTLPWFPTGDCVHMGYKCLAHAAEVALLLRRVTSSIRRTIYRYNRAYCPQLRKTPRC